MMRALCLFLLLSLSACFGSNPLAPSRESHEPVIKEIQPGVLRKYKAFYVPPIELYSIEGDVLRRVSKAEVIDLAESFRSKIIRQLGPKCTSFPQPAVDVALIRIALSDVSTTYSMLQLAPGLVVPNAARGGAVIRARVIDSVSGKEVLTYSDTRQGDRQGFLSGLGKWDGVKRAFDEWAQELGAAVNR